MKPPVANIFALLLFILLPNHAWSGGLAVVTDIAPVHAIVTAITGDTTAPRQLIKGSTSPHDFALRPSDIRKLQTADLIIWVGPLASPGLAKLMAQDDLFARSLRLDSVPNLTTLKLRAPGLFLNGEPQHSVDPHIWLSPANALAWVDTITARLKFADPDNAALFAENAANLSSEITRAQTDVDAMFTEDRLPFVQYHDAFQYFERHFKLIPLGAATTGDQENPALGPMLDLTRALRQAGDFCVVLDRQSARSAAQPLLDLKGARAVVISPLVSDQSGLSYPDFLRSLGQKFADCVTP